MIFIKVHSITVKPLFSIDSTKKKRHCSLRLEKIFTVRNVRKFFLIFDILSVKMSQMDQSIAPTD